MLSFFVSFRFVLVELTRSVHSSDKRHRHCFKPLLLLLLLLPALISCSLPFHINIYIFVTSRMKMNITNWREKKSIGSARARRGKEGVSERLGLIDFLLWCWASSISSRMIIGLVNQFERDGWVRSRDTNQQVPVMRYCCHCHCVVRRKKPKLA